MLRQGWNTLEFWSLIIISILGILKQTAFPDIPTESFAVVLIWIITRMFEKYAVARESLKVDKRSEGIAYIPSINPARATKTSEGLLSVFAAPLLGIAKSVVPSIPMEIFYGIAAYSLSRIGVKIGAKR